MEKRASLKIANNSKKEDESPNKGDVCFFGIGINNYQNGWNSLYNASKDVNDLFFLLVENYGINPNKSIIFSDEEKSSRDWPKGIRISDQSTAENIINELEYVRKNIKEIDSLIIYFAGHGEYEEDTKRVFWIPKDAKINQIGLNLFHNVIINYLEIINAHHILLIVDSCFSEQLAGNYINKRSNSLKIEERYKSRWILCSGRGYVSDGSIGDNSPFAKCILKILKENQIDKMGINQFGEWVKDATLKEYQQIKNQNSLLGVKPYCSPLNLKNHENGQFVFNRQISESGFWEKCSSYSDYCEYLERYPEGDYEKIATEEMRRIEEEEKLDFENLKKEPELSKIIFFKKKYPHSKNKDELSQIEIELKNKRAIIYKPKMSINKDHNVKIIIDENLVFIKGGVIQLKDEISEKNSVKNVNICDFCMSKYLVTNADFSKFLNDTGQKIELHGDELPNYPVVNVSHEIAIQYCDWLSQRNNGRYRLPSEAEWEYVARGGINGDSFMFSGGDDINEVAWFKNNADKKVHEVGRKKPNSLGIFDLSGNVWEWCLDVWQPKYNLLPLDGSPNIVPEIDNDLSFVIRGGSWLNAESSCKVSYRTSEFFDKYEDNIGFRIVKEIDENKK